MDCSAVKRHPRGDGVSSRRDGMASDKVDQLFGGVVEGDALIGVAVSSKDDSSIGLAQSRRSLDEVIQHRLQVKGRAADYLEHVASGYLSPQGVVQLAGKPRGLRLAKG